MFSNLTTRVQEKGLTLEHITIANKCLKNVANFRYVEMTVTNPNFIHEEVEERLISGNSFYLSFQNLFIFPSPN
jgi:hypothetical protein